MMIDLQEEQKLVESSKNDLDAFSELYERYAKKLYSFIFYMVQDHDKAEDIVSQTFEKAMVNIEKFEFRGYSFGSWLYKIGRNIVYDRSKQVNPTSMDEIEEFIGTNDYDPEKSAEKKEGRELLRKLLLLLKDDQREVIYLRYVEEYSIKEVCELTNKTEDSVKSLAKRGLAKLRELTIKNDKKTDE